MKSSLSENVPSGLLPTGRNLVAPIDRLWADAQGHRFFAAIRLLERWYVRCCDVKPEDALTPIRFRHSVHYGFPPSEIEALRRLSSDNDLPDTSAGSASTLAGRSAAAPGAKPFIQVEITLAFMGLIGPSGTLPHFYSERIAAREPSRTVDESDSSARPVKKADQARDGSARAFLDIFLQRSVQMFYRAWRKSRLPLQFELDQRDQFLPMVLSLAGLGQDALRNRMQPMAGGVSDSAIAFMAGLVHHRPVSAVAVRQVVSQYFGVPVQLHEMVGRWYNLPANQRSTLGLGQTTMGTDAVVGDRVWQCGLRVRLDMGPMTRQQFQRLLPGELGATALKELLTLLTGVALEYEIRLVLMASHVPDARLWSNKASTDAPRGATIKPAMNARLGLDAFLVKPVRAGAPANMHDRDDARYLIHATA